MTDKNEERCAPEVTGFAEEVASKVAEARKSEKARKEAAKDKPFTDKQENILKWAEFVATKFGDDVNGWVYSRDLKGLKHIRFKSDSEGYNHWTKRAKRAFNLAHLTGRDSFSRKLGLHEEKLPFKRRLMQAYVWIQISLRKDRNLPDGQINGNYVFWEETGEYMTFFQPKVGVKVIEFLRADPTNPHAQAILKAMEESGELSFPSKKSDEVDNEES